VPVDEPNEARADHDADPLGPGIRLREERDQP
jgi:hypothetical protein